LRIVVVTHYFPPEIGAPQARLSELARTWAEEGDEVTVLTGMPNHPTGIVPPEYKGARRCEELCDGYRVVRTWLYATPNEGFVKKTLGHLSFMASSVVLGATRIGRPEVIVVSSPTFFSIGSAWFLARIRRARLVVEIRDLWPAIFVELGVLTNRRIIRMLELLELAAYRAADAVVVVTDGFRDDLIARGVPPTKVTTIRNGVDLERFTPTPDGPGRSESRRALGVTDDEMLVLYTGAHGISHGLTSIADAAAELRGEPVQFAFVGEGAAKAALVDHIAELGLDNVITRDGVPRDQVPGLLAAADVCLVPLRDVNLFSTFIPSKMFEYLGAGKAVVGSVRGEAAEILRGAGAIVVEPEASHEIADALRALAADPPRRRQMGEQGRAYVEANFDRRELARRYREVLGSVTAEPAVQKRRSTTTRELVAHVWRHPGNAGHGPMGRVRGLGRLLGWQVWQRATNHPVSVRMPGGLKLRCHPHSSAASGVLYCGLPEWSDMRFVLDFLAHGDRFVDGGANVGVFTLLAASRPGVEVWAYEPAPVAFGRLRENIDLNDLGACVHARNVALGETRGTASLTTGLDTTNHIVFGSSAASVSRPVDVVALDDELEGDDRVALVKLDLEGHETHALRGATAMLDKSHPALIVEANDRAALAAQLQPLGYRCYDYDPERKALLHVGWHHDRGNNVLALADLDEAARRLGNAT